MRFARFWDCRKLWPKGLSYKQGINQTSIQHILERDENPSYTKKWITICSVDVARSMGQILQLTDNPEIPSVFTAPSSIRMSRWKAIDTPNHQRPKLWELLPKLNGSVSFSGIEDVVNTPDETTGTYYQYDLYRSVILTQFNGRNLLISLSKQAGISNVGRKGLIIGGDDQWNYYYSNEAGLNRAGFGWVDSYMYDSKSLAFYVDGTPTGNTVRVGVFKWLQAG